MVLEKRPKTNDIQRYRQNKNNSKEIISNVITPSNFVYAVQSNLLDKIDYSQAEGARDGVETITNQVRSSIRFIIIYLISRPELSHRLSH